MGGRSRAAAQLMAGQGFGQVFNLKGGIRAWRGERVRGPAGAGFESLAGADSPAGVLRAALGLEHGLNRYYAELAGDAGSRELGEAFSRLADMESAHLELIHRRLPALEPDTPPLDRLIQEINVPAVEGGLTAEEFVDLYRPVMESPVRAVETAMMFEAQALDLYWRYSEVMPPGPARETLRELADQERDHLRVLGRLRDRYA